MFNRQKREETPATDHHVSLSDALLSTIPDVGAQQVIRVDMHCHSSFSDGGMNPEQLVIKLSNSGVQYAALTDHDTIAGLATFRHAMMRYGIGLVTGLELTTIYGDYKLHLLAYGFNPENPELCSTLNELNSATDNSSVSNNRRFLSTAKAIELIHSAGGLVILAHPAHTEPNFEQLRIIVNDLKKLGLDGIEALYSRNSPSTQEELLHLAAETDMIVSAGTDYHTADGAEPGINIPLSQWKTFRDAMLKVASTASWKKATPTPAPQPQPAKRHIHWSSFIFNIVMPAILSLALFIVALFSILLPYFEKTLLERKRENIRELTQVAWGVLNEATQEVQNNQLTLEQAQALAKNRIEAMRYGRENKDYFWLQDLSPRILMHPYRPDLNDQDVSDFQDPQGRRIFVAFSDLVREQGEGYISYVWQWMGDFERMEPKESYIRLFEPWGWIIGTGIYVHDVKAEISNLRNYLVKMSFGIVAMVLLLLVYLVRQSLFLEQSRSYAEKLLHESIERYRALTEAATEGAIFVYAGRCRYANAVMYELLGCVSTHIELMDLNDIFPDVEANRKWRQCLSNPHDNDCSAMFSGVLKRCDGNQLSCTLTMRHEINNSHSGFMVLVRRATDSIEHTGTRIALNRLLQLPTNIASNLTAAIGQSNKINEVIALCRQASDLVQSLLENGTSSIAITHMISTITDATTQRIIDLCIEELGPPPAPYVFLVLGSQGRQSQTLYSDQDNAIIYKLDEKHDNTDINTDTHVENYFLKLAALVCEYLEQAGYHKCPGKKTADNPQWCKPLFVWKNYFNEWIRNSEPQQVIEFSIFFDFRPVSGDPELARELRNNISAILHETPFFLSQLAQNALIFKTPIRLFGTIVTSGAKEHSGRIDVKTPAMAIVSFARLYALQQNILETNTLARLDALRRTGLLLDAKHRDIVTSYEYLLRLRLWNQSLAVEQNRQPDNWVNPSQLGHMEEVVLRECFKEIEDLQNYIQRDFLC